ncbi:MAG TPA: SDR family oxidoreductase, partial [Chloroflexota bacterium]|nr:SDR family oxidoreductase [Chloroflexota bacterium]
MPPPILVTGATGRIGTELVRRLTAAGTPVRALVHTPPKASSLSARQVEVVLGDFDDPASLDRAVAGVERVFLVSPPQPDQVRLQGNVVRAAQRGGVRHIVKISALGASPDWPLAVPRWHWQTEQQIEQADLAFTHLRPNYFMQMILPLAPEVIQRGTVSVPAGTGRISMVDARDVAAVAAGALLEAGHEGRIYEITGPEALAFSDVAQHLSETIGRPVRYVDIDPESALNDLVSAGLPTWPDTSADSAPSNPAEAWSSNAAGTPECSRPRGGERLF